MEEIAQINREEQLAMFWQRGIGIGGNKPLLGVNQEED
jgi:hypothetical protein